MNKVLLLGYSGFPQSKSAAAEKQKLIAKAINMNTNYDTEILNYISFSKNNYDRQGVCDGVNYRLTCIFSKYPQNKITRFLNLYFGYINEYLYVMFSNYDYLIISSRNSIYMLGHMLISKIRNKKLCITMVEDYNSLKSNSIISKIKIKLFYGFVLKYIDGAFPISTLIANDLIRVNKKLPYLELPVFTNFENFQNSNSVKEKDYFLYCGGAGYFDTIKFIIDSFNYSTLNSGLILVVNGSKNQINKVLNYIELSKNKNTIKLKSNLSYEKLVAYYKNAVALLIPLRPEIKDEARFPHKIAEYCASKRPIISSNLGEVKNFFEHNKNALLLNRYEIFDMNSLMRFVEQNTDLSNKIGAESYKLGYDKFNYKSYSNKITNFLQHI